MEFIKVLPLIAIAAMNRMINIKASMEQIATSAITLLAGCRPPLTTTYPLLN
jgi:hypothetical protein